MKIKYTNNDLRAMLVANWKKKIIHIIRKYVLCSFKNKFCDSCKESEVCERIEKKPWVGKI
jgi:hypothetical protein